ncbi:MBL fold metallo-hydrolase [Shewanella youngdeokensis]|uniref:MBL fold metallo-hydrolase n=1 Tax=Shewanella youngdeokensis TaxID=2999068 RepID=A0ABZ0JWE3_9GAMM|nr:MBL fold metallo-hydrolase [Shewanella sp. DAU334]
MISLSRQLKLILMVNFVWLMCTNTAVHANDKFAKVQIKPIKITDTIYMFTGAGGNIGVSAGSDGLLIIDDQFAPLANKISAALNQLQTGAPKFIINTHFHSDHTGSNSHFGQQGTIMAHHNVLKRLVSDSKFQPNALPVITYNEGISVHFNNDVLQVAHMGPGHTDGDSVVIWSNDKVVHMGDLFFKDKFPYIDLNAGGSVQGYRDNVASIVHAMEPQTQVIPGHGSLANKSDLLRFKHMLDTSINWMHEQKALGLTLSELKKQGVPEPLAAWSWQFITEDKWIETLYKDL